MFALNGTLSSSVLSFLDLNIRLCRLLEHAANYFDLSTFTDGETKRALQRVVNKRAGKVEKFEPVGKVGRVEKVGQVGKVGKRGDIANGDTRETKKRKKN